MTRISQRNNGKFPTLHTYKVIDGRKGLKVHGAMEIPIWGSYFKRDAIESIDPYDTENAEHDARVLIEPYEGIVHGRILSIVNYLLSIQVE